MTFSFVSVIERLLLPTEFRQSLKVNWSVTSLVYSPEANGMLKLPVWVRVCILHSELKCRVSISEEIGADRES